MKVLVTGGSGLVGSYLKKIIPDATYVSTKDFDLTSIKDVEKMFEIHNPDIVVHLAAKVGGLIDNIDYPADYYDDNIMMNTNTLKLAHKHGVKRFLGILSSCAYPDEVRAYPIKEESLHLGPPNKSQFSYGISKRSFAVQIEAYNKQYGTNYQYLIPCNLYGESDKIEESKSHYVTSLIKKIYDANKNEDDHITLYGDGTPIRQFMHAEDMAKIIKIIIDENITESFNVAPKEGISIKDIAIKALKATNSEHLLIKFNSKMPNGQIRKDLDISKMKSLIPGYKYISLQEGIKTFYEFYKKNSE
jgi:GDP-L-fucose synthase